MAKSQVGPWATKKLDRLRKYLNAYPTVFMRKKLEASQKVLEGLTAEDFDLISEGAKQLKATSAAADFIVHDDMMYKDHADDFRRIVLKLEKAGRELRLDGALLAYVDMTMSCVECHKYVRHVLIAQK